MIEIVEAGPQTTVQDLGRPGFGRWGIPASGAADRASLRLVNRLVGNAESAAGLEILLGPFVAVFHESTTVALSGARVAAHLDGRPITSDGPVGVRPASRLDLGSASDGVRIYLGVRGGLDTPVELGSRSSDTQSRIGLPPLRNGTRLAIAADRLKMPGVDFAPRAPLPDVFELDLVPGPRADWFAPDAVDVLYSSTYRVTADCDRVGLRLTGPALPRLDARELPSEGVVRGAVEVLPTGQPVLLLVDYPTTCGYPVIGVVEPGSLDLAGQAGPGRRLRFRRCPALPADY